MSDTAIEVEVVSTPQVGVDVQVAPPTFTVVSVLPTGPRGPVGATGATGPAGAAGATGPAGPGVPAGGTAGQVLTKDSDTDLDTSWQDPTGGGGSGIVETVVAGSGIAVNATDPANPIVTAEVTQAELDAEAALARNADNLTSGTVADARIPATIARDSEVSAAIATSEAGQVRDGDTAGGVLSGTYPNPGFAADMATQAELDAHIADTTDAHDASAVSFTPSGLIVATDVQAALVELDSEKAALAGASFTGASPVTIDTVTAANLITLPNGTVNGYVVKVVADQTGYGRGQAFMVLATGTDATDQTSAGSVRFRVDNDGNIGSTGVMHLATGARPGLGISPTYVLQLQPTTVGTTLLELAPPSGITSSTRIVKGFDRTTPGSERFYIDRDYILVGMADDFTNAAYYLAPQSAGFGGVRALFNTAAAATIGVFVKGFTGQTGDLTRWVNVSNTILARVDKNGYLIHRKTAAPADGDLSANDLTFWLDATAGTPTIRAKLKDSAGTVANRTIVTTTEGVLLTGAQTVAGVKTFSSSPVVPTPTTDFQAATKEYVDGHVAESIVDAKGDLIVATAADTVSRLAVGTNGQVLTADSAETSGVKWAAQAAAPSTLWLPASVFGASAGGSPVLSNVDDIPAWLLDQTTVESVATTVLLPSDWATFNAEIVWTHASAGSGNVVLNMAYKSGWGDTEAAGVNVAGSNQTVATPATAASKWTTALSGIAVPSAGELLSLRVRRVANDAADTFAADIGVVAVRLTKAS